MTDQPPTREVGPGNAAGPATVDLRVLRPGVGVDLARHLNLHGAPPLLTGPQLIAAVQEAGLTGRGGAAFPTGRKLATVAAAAGRKGTVVIANGCEGEPLSRKDKP